MMLCQKHYYPLQREHTKCNKKWAYVASKCGSDKTEFICQECNESNDNDNSDNFGPAITGTSDVVLVMAINNILYYDKFKKYNA